MKNVGFIGWRGMVGSVLMQRMVEERDFDAIRPVFLLLLSLARLRRLLAEPLAHFRMPLIWEALKALDIIVTCQAAIILTKHPKLRESGWQGYWIDAASSLRDER